MTLSNKLCDSFTISGLSSKWSFWNVRYATGATSSSECFTTSSSSLLKKKIIRIFRYIIVRSH